MFSDHVQKIERSSGRTLFLIAGALVILCQLVAMGMVADGQVQKAAARDSRLSSQRVALAECFENTLEAARGSCVRQVYNDNNSESTLAAGRDGGVRRVQLAICPTLRANDLAGRIGVNWYGPRFWRGRWSWLGQCPLQYGGP
jgi:hypothetical protein